MTECRYPIRLRATLAADVRTGEVREADGGPISVPCGSRWETRCPSCSRTYRKRTHLVIASGLPDPKEAAAVFLVTLTSPSFGPVHTPGWKKGRPKPARGQLRRCRCGKVHNPETRANRAVLGSPLDPSQYDYVGAVAWNATASNLWSAWRHRLTRAVSDVADGLDVQICRIAEPQRRGQQHFHALLVFRPGDAVAMPSSALLRTVISGTLPTPAAEVAALINAGGVVSQGPQVHDEHTGRTFGFGDQSDVRALNPRAGRNGGDPHWGAVAGYLAKYLTKSTGGDVIGDRVPEDSAIAKHLRRLGAVARSRLVLANARRTVPKHLRRGDISRVVSGCGYAGPPRSSTRRWGTTLGKLKTAARAWAREKMGLPVEPREVWNWFIDWTETMRYRQLLLVQAAARAHADAQAASS